jgi:hypothetical protein
MPRLPRLIGRIAITGLLIGISGSQVWAEAKLSRSNVQLARTPAEAREHLGRIVDVAFENVKVGDLSMRLEEFAGIVTWVDPRALRGRGTDKFSFRARKITVAEALDSLLKGAGWCWSLKGATLCAESEATSDDYGVVRLYDVRDLAYQGDDARYERYDLHQFADLVPGSVARETWTPAGGLGTLRPVTYGGRAALAVRQSETGHRRVAELLSQMRRSLRSPDLPTEPRPDPLKEQPAEPRPDQSEAPGWWPELSVVAQNQMHLAVYAEWPSGTPESPFVICGGSMVTVKAPDTQTKLLAWYVVEDDLPLVKVRALVWSHSDWMRLWRLTAYAWSPFDLRQPRESGLAPVWQSDNFRRPPRNKDVLKFLDRLDAPWRFDVLRAPRLLAGNFRVDDWYNAMGEEPSRFYPVRLPSTYQLPAAVRRADQQRRNWQWLLRIQHNQGEMAQSLDSLKRTVLSLPAAAGTAPAKAP